MRGETLLLDLRREYHCSAYNALMSVISCTQTELKFYNGFLFSENLTKVHLTCTMLNHNGYSLLAGKVFGEQSTFSHGKIGKRQ